MSASLDVLVVDDSPEICRLLRIVLSQAGYHVWTATSGEAAVGVVQRAAGRIRFALVDILMEPQDGPATVRALQQIDPKLAFVFMSGYGAGYTAEELLGLGARAILGKPFQIHEVVRLVQEFDREIRE